MLAMDVETTLDLQTLDGLDFPTPCGHPHHEIYKEFHDDGAAHWIYTYQGPCGFSVTRAVCDKFADTLYEAPFWMCSGCRCRHEASEVRISLEPLNPES